MSFISLEHSNEVNDALVEDNLDYFKFHYQEVYSSDLEEPLVRACLCGSENIANFLLKGLHASYTDEEYRYLLGYVSASPNETLAKTIAEQIAKEGLEMPDNITSLAASYGVIDEIKEIFRKSAETRLSSGNK
jgi:hypothetical protein